MEDKIELELLRVLSINTKYASISIDYYLRSNKFKEVYSTSCDTHNLEWLRKRYRDACQNFGYMPLEFALNNGVYYKTPSLIVFAYTSFFTHKRKYIAVLVDEGGKWSK